MPRVNVWMVPAVVLLLPSDCPVHLSGSPEAAVLTKDYVRMTRRVPVKGRQPHTKGSQMVTGHLPIHFFVVGRVSSMDKEQLALML